MAKSLSAGADLILLPYNYLVDPRTRRLNTKNLQLSNAILIFDEAHNVESSCGEACSIEITVDSLREALQEAQEARRLTHQRDYLGDLTEDFITQAESKSARSPSLDFVRHLLGLIEGAELNNGLLIRAGVHIYTVIHTAMRAEAGVKTLSNILNSMGTLLAMSKKGGKELLALDSTLRTLYLPDSEDAALSSGDAEFYRLVIRQDERGMRILSLWCFSAGIVMRQLKEAGVRSIVLASGTLSPLPSLATELQT